MKIQHLQRLFENLPSEIIEDLKDIDFKTCWYGSASFDKRPMELLDYSHKDTLITNKDKVDVFFYTDIEYFFLKNRIYSNRFHGEVLFNDSLISNFNLDLEDRKDYILSGDLICADLILKNKELVPDTTDRVIDYVYKEKSWLKSKFADFWEIIEQLYPELSIIDYEFTQKMNHDYETMTLIGLGIEKEDKKKIIDFVDFKYQKLQKPELLHFDFSNYTFNAAVVKHKRKNDEPFYTIYIDIDDWTFEQLLIEEKVKINYAVHNGGWAGPGPRCLGNLQAEYEIGCYMPAPEVTDFEIIPFTHEFVKEFIYRIDDTNNPILRSFNKIYI
jgi:hypothetical protein